MTDYFGQPACLAQSPQLFKQMTAACAGFERVMEVSPCLLSSSGTVLDVEVDHVSPHVSSSRLHMFLCE